MKIFDDITMLVGKTPIVELKQIAKGSKCRIFAKLEYFNPMHSVKDRAALGMINDAIIRGILKEGDTVVEATSGNTGIALAWICAVKKLKLIIVMPSNMSAERRKILSYFGAEILLSEASGGMSLAVETARQLSLDKNFFLVSQFQNNSNVVAHYSSTGPEIESDMDGKVDILIFPVGTGGTLTGAGSYLKEKIKNIKIVAVEPAKSAVLSGFERGAHKIQGIGAGFVPDILNKNLIDEVEAVKEEDAFSMARELALKEGIFAGISSGAAVKAALNQAEKNSGKNIVAIICDTAERYISTELFK